MKQEVMQEGVLCQLKMGRWDASIRMSKDKFGKELPKEIVRAMQDLVEDRTLIKNLDAIRRSAKNTLKNNSLPFPVDGIFWCPKDKIPLLDDCFTKLKVERRKSLSGTCRSSSAISENVIQSFTITIFTQQRQSSARSIISTGIFSILLFQIRSLKFCHRPFTKGRRPNFRQWSIRWKN
jgi:hypothetical protein